MKTFAFLFATALGGAIWAQPAAAVPLIDFESGIASPTTGTDVTTQFQASHGVVFSTSDGSNAFLGETNTATNGVPTVGNPQSGWAYNQTLGDITAPGQPSIGRWFLDFDGSQGGAGNLLIITFDNLTAAAGADLIDVDGNATNGYESWNVNAYDANHTLLQTITISGDDANAGNGIVTHFAFNFGTPLIKSIEFDRMDSGGGGFALDNFTPSDPGLPAVPEPATVGLTALGLAAAARRRSGRS